VLTDHGVWRLPISRGTASRQCDGRAEARFAAEHLRFCPDSGKGMRIVRDYLEGLVGERLWHF
jgi:hypothetical protein